jgi:CTP synthase
LATIEFARNVLGLKGANSTELDSENPHPVVNILPEQKGVDDMGATMRLGDHEVNVSKGKARDLYGTDRISERHRHRYEINREYIDQIEAKGLKYTGRDISGRRMEILELEGHPYFIASQFHPEFKSRPDEPSPLHLGLVKAALAHKKG